jgi:hypothetical protein
MQALDRKTSFWIFRLFSKGTQMKKKFEKNVWASTILQGASYQISRMDASSARNLICLRHLTLAMGCRIFTMSCSVGTQNNIIL